MTELLPRLPREYPMPVIVALHLHPSQGGFFTEYFDERCALTVKEAEDKECIEPGYVYFAPPDYHLLVENNRTFSLSVDAKINHARPSIDVLFESAADAYSSGLVGIIMSGANNDGARGLNKVKRNGGLAVVQDPATAECSFMPQAAIDAGEVDHILPLEQIARLLMKLGET